MALLCSCAYGQKQSLPAEEMGNNVCQQYSTSRTCEADGNCKWCLSSTSNLTDGSEGACRSENYNATAGEQCDAHFRCKGLGPTDACTADARCKRCDLHQTKFSYCTDIDSDEKEVAACDKIDSNTSTASLNHTIGEGSNSTDLYLNAAAVGSGYWRYSRGRWYWIRRRHAQRRKHLRGKKHHAASSRRRQHQAHGRRKSAGGSSSNGGTMTLYHQTSPALGRLILRSGFRPGSAGWCGGAIYFATSPGATTRKAIGAQSHKGFMLRCQVSVGKMKNLDRRCSGGRQALGSGYSVHFNPGDGDEFVVSNGGRVRGCTGYPFR